MKRMSKPSAKILSHAEGVGPPTSDMVRQRAEEIARINGREEHNEEDWREAYFEVHGHHPVDDQELLFSGHDMLAYDYGHHTENIQPDDSESISEELISEGMEEAIHERMLEASMSEEKEGEG